jgi:hypothetical protein
MHRCGACVTAAAVVVLALVGCGGDGGEPAAGALIDEAAASQLAARSDEIARLLEDGDVCSAATRADELRALTQAKVADGSVPTELRAELVSSVNALAEELTCEDQATPPPPPPPTPPGPAAPAAPC